MRVSEVCGGIRWEDLNEELRTVIVRDRKNPRKKEGNQMVVPLLGEGASRLFEKGFTIEEVAQVTGHRNLNTLWQVYTQLFPHKLHGRKI